MMRGEKVEENSMMINVCYSCGHCGGYGCSHCDHTRPVRDAYQEGRNAHPRIPRDANPYAKDTPSRSEWFRGWDEDCGIIRSAFDCERHRRDCDWAP